MAAKMEVRINWLVVLCGCLCLALTGECPGGPFCYHFNFIQRKDMRVVVQVVVFLSGVLISAGALTFVVSFRCKETYNIVVYSSIRF